MNTVFRKLTSADRFTVVIGGVEYNGKKVPAFRVLAPQRNSYIYINAVLIPSDKFTHGSNGLVAVISGATIVAKAA